jgi:molecular chaperone GrpE
MTNKNNNQEAEKKELEDSEKLGAKIVTLSETEYQKLVDEASKTKEYWERILRLQADFDNTRKRLDRDRQDFVRYANEGIIVELLNILDDLERTVELAQDKHQDLNNFSKGVEMILAHLYDMLKKYGVRPIDSEGKIFDPNYHEALMQIVDKNFPEHTIVEELQKGYMLNDKVIRTAKVKVSKLEEVKNG